MIRNYKLRYEQSEVDGDEIKKYDNLKLISDLGLGFGMVSYKYNRRMHTLSMKTICSQYSRKKWNLQET
jgi:hypothetical protein